MFRSLVSALIALAMGGAGSALAQSRAGDPAAAVTERLLLTPPAGWTGGGSSTARNTITTHLFPPGQSSETWTEMMSVQVVAEAGADPRAFVQRLIETSRAGCEAAGPSPLAEGTLNNYPVVTMTVTCTRGRQSGMGGLIAVKAIRGRQALYVVQRLWRGPAFRPDEAAPVPAATLQEWAGFLRSVSLCDGADAARHPCPR